jgi:hypothetical protein
VIRGLMTDDEWAIVEPFLNTASLRAWRTPASQPSSGVEWYPLDHPYRRTMAGPAGGARQLEFDLAAVPPLVSVWRMGCPTAGAGRWRR